MQSRITELQYVCPRDIKTLLELPVFFNKSSTGRLVLKSAGPLQEQVGSLEVGKAFDCLIIDCGTFSLTSDRASAALFPYEVFPDDTNLDRLEKFVQIGDDRNIRQVYVNGEQIL